jgi:hypothetical protein
VSVPNTQVSTSLRLKKARLFANRQIAEADFSRYYGQIKNCASKNLSQLFGANGSPKTSYAAVRSSPWHFASSFRHEVMGFTGPMRAMGLI